MEWIDVKKQSPNHKDLCIIELQNGIVQPAIYYDNESFYEISVKKTKLKQLETNP